uniref:Interleukin-7 n=1 Tax=Cyanoderma ruficeps TaxID=181631 RepID=A0A8C3RHJ0_9PASS
MHPHVFLLLLTSGVSSYFLSQEEMLHLLNKTKYALIDEMLCLLDAENEHISEEKFLTPLDIKNLSCAHNNARTFTKELEKIVTWTCIKEVVKGMQKLEETCDILKKSPSNYKSCEKVKKRFSKFKESLQEFLRWVNENANCRIVGRSESGLYLDGKCSCHDPWKSLRGLG